MAGELRTATLAQLGWVITGKTPSSTCPEYFGGVIPFVTPSDMDGRRTIKATERYLTEEGAESVRGCRIPAGAIMVSCIGSDMGKAAIAGRECVTNQQINSIIVETGDSPLFVYYNLSKRKEELRAAAGGSAQPILNKSTFGQLDILLPPPAEQRAIAHILGTLDDKIEVNRKMNQTLEAIARAIFTSWFVDFDPVRAKAEGRDPGLPPDLAALFPARLVDSERGMIPEGWVVRGLGQCLALLKDGSHNPPQRVQEGIPFIAGATDVKHFSVDFTKCTYITEDDYNAMHRKWSVRADDVLLTIVGTVGNVALVSQYDLPFSLQRSIAVLRPGPMLSSSFLYCLLLSAAFRADVDSRLNPTAQPGIYLGTLAAIPICLPTRDVVTAFDRVASAVFTKMQNIVQESRTLAALRDSLLPKLLSGEIRVKDAKKFAEEVV